MSGTDRDRPGHLPSGPATDWGRCRQSRLVGNPGAGDATHNIGLSACFLLSYTSVPLAVLVLCDYGAPFVK